MVYKFILCIDMGREKEDKKDKQNDVTVSGVLGKAWEKHKITGILGLAGVAGGGYC